MTIGRRSLAAIMALVFLAAPLVGEGQHAREVPRIGFLGSSSGERVKSRVDALQEGLQALGYIPGQSVLIEVRSAEGKFERLPGLAAELVRLKVNVLVAEGSPAAHAAKSASSTIPIVIGNAGDPVGTGLVASLAKPGGNITGMSDFARDVITKRLEILREVVPAATRIAALSNPASPTHPLQLKEIQAAAPALGVTLVTLESRGPDDLDRAFAAMRTERASAFLVLADAMFGTHRKRIAELATKARLPAMYWDDGFVDVGGLMSFGVSFDEIYRRAATYVDRILKGAKPGDLPVEQPTKFLLVVNLKAAKQIGLTIPQSVHYRADRVVQ